MILIATGAEVGVALEAARTMDANTRVVSMPCWELFADQPAEYREEVLPGEVRARLSVEAGISLGWERWVGDAGTSVAVDRFGASAPGDEVLRRLGFTAENIAERAAALLERVRMRVAVAFDHRGVKLRERVLARARGTSGTRRSISGPTPTRSGSTIPTRHASSARRSRTDGRSAAFSSAAPASARRSRPASSPGSAPRSATTRTPRTRASSTTT